MGTMQAAAEAPKARQTRIRWKRVVLAAFLAELAVIAAISLVFVTYTMLIAPGRTSAEYDEFGQNVGYYVAAPAAAAAVFLMALWVVGPLDSHFILNGLAVGIIATLLTLGFVVGARPGDRWMYVASFMLRIAAGYAAGIVAQRRKERK